MRSAACLAIALVACSRGPIAPTAATVAVTLDGTWSTKPWLVDPPSSVGGQPFRFSTNVVVPESLAGRPASLLFEGLWWSAVVFIDGKRVGAMVGGQAPVRLPLPEGLSAGPHDLMVAIAAPRGVSKFVHGGGLGSNASANRPVLHRPPVLEFTESVEVISAGVTRSDRGVGAFAIVDPTDVSDGASAHLVTALDGRIQTDFGTLPIEADGTVRFPPRRVDQPLWSWGDPALTHLMVEVRNAAGAVVSTWSTRTGVRSTQMTPKGLRINENLGLVAAIRVPHGLNEPDMLTVFSSAVGGGANAVEIHGAMADSELMDTADEMGIPIIHLPRCVGRVGRPPGNGASLLETLRSQDERLVRAVGAHPSVVSWLIEGDRQILGPGRKESGELDTFTSVIPSDPMERPVVGVDIPGTLLRIPDLRKADINCPAGCEGKWIVESTFRIVPTPSLWHSVAAAWSRALAKGIPGGTLPSAKVSELAVWSEAFSPVLAEAGVKPFPLDRTRRADSRIQISGAAAGSVVWVTAPGMTPKGAQVASDGTATVDVWYSGSATVHGVGWSQDVSLSAMSWKGPKLYGYSTEVVAPEE